LSIISINESERDFLADIKEIFFDSSEKKDFTSEEAKADFFHHWCGQYLQKFPETFLVFVSDDKAVGYLCYVEDTNSSYKDLGISSMDHFKEVYTNFPAHLHINVHSSQRGKGLGAKLLVEMERRLMKKDIPGVFLITDPTARNVSFYKRNGYDFAQEYHTEKYGLLLLGKKL
jgi:ribosomal protein S18 acetylase RimI-like enzyme